MENILSSLSVAFIGGVATSFTPCVYPLIPVTLAIFGATAEIPRWKAFCLSLSYVLGMAVMYTSLGLLSAFTGSLFGEALRNPWIISGMGLFLLILSLYTLDIIKFDAAYRLQSKASAIGGRGFIGSFLMGTASGVVAAPCAAPLLITILGLAAQTQSALLGSLLLFTYAFGFGLIFLFLGTFSGLVHKLPRSGDWLYVIKFAISTLLLMVAIFLIRPLLPDVRTIFSSTGNILLVIFCGVIAFLSATIGYRKHPKAVKFLCAALLAASLFQIYEGKQPASPSKETKAQWANSIEEAKTTSRDRNVILVDFYADWCANCKEYESKIFVQPKVTEAFRSFSLARIDLTLNDEVADSIQEKYSIKGLPSIIFLCPSGNEISNSRIEGFLNEQGFIDHLLSVIARAEKSCL